MDGRKKVLIEHPTGNENTRHAVLGLYANGMLQSFHTCVACFQGSLSERLARLRPLNLLTKRTLPVGLKPFTRLHPVKEILRIANRYVHWFQGITVDYVYHELDKTVARYIHRNRKGICAVYAYDEGAYYSFRQAKSDGIKCLFDLPIIHWRTYQRLLASEREKHPGWAAILGIYDDSKEKLARKDQELLMADHIFVASSFTKESILKDFPYKMNATIDVVPYGFPPVNRHRKYRDARNRKLNFLFVGRLVQSKGLSYLFESVKPFCEYINLTVVGDGEIDKCPDLRAELALHKHIPQLFHQDLLRLMAESDVLIFPSLFEGFGMVVTESMSQGTPVLTTESTCGLNFIKDGENGWLVKPASTVELKDKIRQILEERERLEEIGRAALNTAAQRPWSLYENELAEAIRRRLSKG